MRVKDVMTPDVICVDANEPVLKAARLMLQRRISGLPVLDKEGELVGIVTEGDFLRRGELGTQRRPDRWTIAEGDRLEAVVDTMERHHVKRLPVTRGGRMVGIVSRANLMHALASIARDITAIPPANDSIIRQNILTAIAKQDWAPHINVIVKNGIAELYGVITDDRERQGLIVAAENVPGVQGVHDHLVWIEPISGMAFPSSEDENKQHAAS